MALKTVDLTQQPHRATFTGCSQDEIIYAKTFWQSLQLLPPMESRLVSSDIKQRLRKAPPSRSMSECYSYSQGGGACRAAPARSFSVSLSNSSQLQSETNSKLFVRFESNKRTDSMITQTSQLINFGEITELAEEDTKCPGPYGKERNDGEPSHEKPSKRRVSISAAEKSGDGSQTAGSKVCVSGAGGPEFWSRWPAGKEEYLVKELTGTVAPFSGEHLCRRKGFKNQAEQNFLWKQTGVVPTVVECGGEELKGKPVNKPHSVSPLQCTTDDPKFKTDCGEKAKPSQSPPGAPADKNKKRQRAVGTQRLVGTHKVVSLFQSGNIQSHDVPPPSWPRSIVKPVTQLAMRVLPASFRKHLTPSSGGSCVQVKAIMPGEDSSTVSEPVQTKTSLPKKNQKEKEIGSKMPQQLSDSGEKLSQNMQKGTENSSKIMQQFSDSVEKNVGRSVEQPRNPSEITDVQCSDSSGLPPLAKTPAILTRPRPCTNIFFWDT